MNRVHRIRPYDYRRDGAIGNATGTPNYGGIFGQRNCPANHTGIFEAQWALPTYVEEAELTGGPLYSNTLKADVTMSDPVERNIRVPDLGPDSDGWRMPWPKSITAKKLAARKLVARRRGLPWLGADPEPAPAPPPVQRPGFFSRPVAGPAVLIGIGLLLAKVLLDSD
jgi:hypothetical protein